MYNFNNKSNTLFSYQVAYAIRNNNKTVIEKYLKNNLISILIKYTGNIEKVFKKFCIVEKISDEHAIITCSYTNYFKVISKKEVISSELTYETNFFQEPEKAIDNYKDFTCLSSNMETGKNTIIGVIDSGINYNHPDFLNEDGTTKIKYILDFSLEGNGFQNLKTGRLFTENEINEAIQNNTPLEHIDTIGHGTSVASICAGNTGVAPKATLCIVKLSKSNTKSHEILKGIYFLRELSKYLQKPLVINLSIGGNNTSHSGLTLYEQYLNKFGKLNNTAICVASGNEGVAGHHYILYKSDTVRVISNLKKYNLYIFTPKDSKVKFQLTFDTGVKSVTFTKEEGVKYFKENGFEYYISYGSDDNDIYDTFNILVNFDEQKSSVTIVNFDILRSSKEIHMYLPTLEKVGEDTYFANSSLSNTLTFPSTAKEVITVAGVNSSNNTVAPFSGRGYTVLGNVKPDITAPAVDIRCAESIFGYTFKTGTSFATPIVSGICSLIFENNQNLRGDELKVLLQNSSTKLPSLNYPNEDFGYGFVCYEKAKNTILEEKLFVNYLVEKKIDDITITNINFKIIDEVFDYYILEVNYKEIPRFQNAMYEKEIEFEKVKILGLSTESSIDSTGVPSIWENQNLFGKNTITASIDTGISVKKPIFISKEKTRVNYIYDIEENKLYTKEEIQEVIDKDLKDFDEIGHGTKLFAISSGNKEDSFSGIARESNILCSKISDTTKGNKISSFIEDDMYGVSSIDALKGLEFLLNYKKECNMPMVVSLPLTTNEGSRLNMGIFEKIINVKSKEKGLCIVTPTGNDGLSKRHSSIFLKKDIKTYFSIKVGDSKTKLSIYTRKNQSFFVTIGTASFEEYSFILSKNTTFTKETFDYNIYVNFNNTNEYTEIEFGFDGFIRGIWYVELTSLYADVSCEMYLPIKSLTKRDTEFLSSRILGTIGIPASVPNVICTSGYNHKTGEFYSESGASDAPLYREIDVSAPAVDILTIGRLGETIVSGTSMSVAHTTGLISLIFEKHPNYNVTDIRKILRRNAKEEYDFDSPNNFYGFGTLFLDDIK